jgi:hypothetical protein
MKIQFKNNSINVLMKGFLFMPSNWVKNTSRIFDSGVVEIFYDGIAFSKHCVPNKILEGSCCTI